MILIFHRSIVAYIPFWDGEDIGPVSVFYRKFFCHVRFITTADILTSPQISHEKRRQLLSVLSSSSSKTFSPASPGIRLISRIPKFFVPVATTTFWFVLTSWHHHCHIYILYHHHIYHQHNFTFTRATRIGYRNINRVTRTDAAEETLTWWNQWLQVKVRNLAF